ncbi:MAG: hypothetical protein NDI60_00795 [Elusimicrobiales bacterium]|nr:hypothetical protein [Elusimicrobiales bacterium]
MKTFRLLLLLCLAPGLAAAAQEGWTVKVRAINGRYTYSHEQPVSLRKQENFTGVPRMRGGGPERELIFNSYLNSPQDGLLRLDYQVELGGENTARPPFQAAGKVLLRPGKPVLAVDSGGWKIVLELEGSAEGEYARGGTSTLEVSLKCGRDAYPAKFTYLPEHQYSAILYSAAGDAVRKFMVGLLPNNPGIDGEFKLQYTLLLREGAETLASGQGELILAPGGPRRSAAAGKDCVFSAKASR